MKKIGEPISNETLLSVKGGNMALDVFCQCLYGETGINQWYGVYNTEQFMWDDVVYHCGYIDGGTNPYYPNENVGEVPNGYCEPAN